MPKTIPAIILQLKAPNVKQYDMIEFKELARAAHYKIVDVITQNRSKADSKYFFGSGKVKEIASLIQDSGLMDDMDIHDKVEKRHEEDITFLVNNRLKSSQMVTLSESFRSKVVDRDLLILEIFEEKASTHESKLQIKLARLALQTSAKQRELSAKLKSERPGRDYHGTGYSAADVYDRAYRKQRKKIMEELMEIRQHRAVQRKNRHSEFNVAIVGYTNAGKTTFLNTLKKTDFETKDTAFTTVSTITRRLKYMGDVILFTDTVGFVYDIPHEIIEAFLSTLEEAAFADCILLLIDIKDDISEIQGKNRTTYRVMAKIGALEVPIVYAFNKIDLLDDLELKEKKKDLQSVLPPTATVTFISALSSKSIFRVVNLLRMVKNKKLIISMDKESIQEFVEGGLVEQKTKKRII